MESGPKAKPPKDPQPSVDRIDELARRILSGDILLPKFQREFVWDKTQIIELLDSVGRGYPIGSVLLWQSREELRNENKIADLDIELPRPDYPVNYLLDGQQRLSTICGALFWAGSDAKSRWNLVYDLRAQTFEHLDSLDDPPLHRIKVNKLSDPSAFFAHVASLDTLTAPDKEELKLRANLLFNRFKDYKIATVTLGDMPLEDVAPIFERINSTGTRLTIVDLMRAATWSPDFDLVDSIQGIRDDLTEKGFEGIDRKVVLRNLSAASGGGFTSDSIDDLRHREIAQLQRAVEATRTAYKLAVDFLTTHIRAASADAVPYANQITVLAEIFRQLPTPSADQYKAINNWFWETALAGYFGGWNTGQMSADLAAVGEFANGNRAAVEYSAVLPSTDVWVVRQFRSNYALAKLLGLVLAHHNPMDLLTGVRIDTGQALAWTNAKEFHHLFPRSYLKREGVDASKGNALANIVMLTSSSNKTISDKAPSAYLKDVEAAAGSDLETVLASNLISEDAFKAAKQDDYDAFLAARSKTIQDAVLRMKQ